MKAVKPTQKKNSTDDRKQHCLPQWLRQGQSTFKRQLSHANVYPRYKGSTRFPVPSPLLIMDDVCREDNSGIGLLPYHYVGFRVKVSWSELHCKVLGLNTLVVPTNKHF